jgi:hypothetical protein
VLALGGLIGVARPFVHRACLGVQAWRRARKAQWQQSAAFAWKQIPQQLETKPAQLSAVYLWLKRSGQGLQLSALGPQMRSVLQAFYGSEPTVDQTLARLRETLSTLHSQAEHRRTVLRPALRPLNPVHEKDFP